MPDGAAWFWVDPGSGRLSAQHCPGAIQVPYVAGSEPRAMTECLAADQGEDNESIWRKLFGKKN